MTLQDCMDLYFGHGIATTIDADSQAYLFVIEKAKDSAKISSQNKTNLNRG